MKYDDLLVRLGEFGTYQRIQYLFVALISITSAFHSMNMVFVGPTADHRCNIPDPPPEWQSLDDTQILNLSVPVGDDPDTWSSCTMYNLTDVDWTVGGYDDWAGQERTVHKCSDGWWYSQEHYGSTIVGEWDLVCDKADRRGIGSTIFFAGRLVGAFASGILSDRLGRRPVFFLSLTGQILVGCAAAASPWLAMFYVFYFLQGVFQVAVYLSTYVIGMEVVGPKYRKLAGMMVNIFYAVGQMILTGIAYMVRDWRRIEVLISVVPVVFFSYYWLMNESIRWLLSQGRIEEADKIIQKSARINKVDIDKGVTSELELETDGVSYSLLDIFKTWNFAKIALNIWFGWFVNALVYYGLNLNSSELHGDPYLNFFLLACVEIPGVLLGLFLLDIVGRRWLMFAFMFVAGAGCLASGFTTGAVSLWTSLVGKLAITASYAIIYIMAAETFPTVLRNSGMGMASVCARLGGMVAPQFLILADYYKPLPLLLFGVLSILGGLMCLLLPETKGKPLPQNIQEIVMDLQGKIIGERDGTEDREIIFSSEGKHLAVENIPYAPGNIVEEPSKNIDCGVTNECYILDKEKHKLSTFL